MSQDLTDKSTLVQVMAWCREATSHYLNLCWPISPTPCDVTRPQWVKTTPQHRYDVAVNVEWLTIIGFNLITEKITCPVCITIETWQISNKLWNMFEKTSLQVIVNVFGQFIHLVRMPIITENNFNKISVQLAIKCMSWFKDIECWKICLGPDHITTILSIFFLTFCFCQPYWIFK